MLLGATAPADPLAPLAKEPALVLAVSGGPDSVALMLLAAQWPPRARHEIAVATVDHGLRDGSREEALRVAEWATALGFEHRILTWDGPKPATRVQEKARDARYALLCAFAHEFGGSHARKCAAVVTAHHADDQAETILFRLARGSGVAGLAGMAAATTRGDVRLLRPLLGVPKAALEAVCVAAGHPFVRDPSNENMRFARTRLRALGELLSSQGLDAKALARLGERAARADAALDWCAARAGAAAAASRDEAMTKLDSTALRELPLEILRRLLAAEIHARGSAAPRLDRLERAAEFVALGLREGVEGRITLAGLSIRVNNREVTLTAAPPRFRGRGKPRAAPAKVLNDL